MALAFSEKAALVAIDDRQGINACKLLRISFTTAINILICMREKGEMCLCGEIRRRRATLRLGENDAAL